MSGKAIFFDRETQSLVVGLISRTDSARIDSHPLRAGRDRQDFVSELLLRGLNQPELVRSEEAAQGGIPTGFHPGEVDAVTCVDLEREVFDIVIRLISLPGRRLVVRIWYPPADSPRQGPHQYFNEAVGLRPEARLFGRELEIEGRRLLVKYWHEHTSEGVVERFQFFKTTAENAA
jgi:hypothetical protein